MRKTALTAAGLALGVISMAGIAYAAGPRGPISTQKSSVISIPDDRGGHHDHDADDAVRHEVGDDRGGDRGGMAPAAHILSRTSPARTVTVAGASVGRRVSDDPVGHDATDDRGSGGRSPKDD